MSPAPLLTTAVLAAFGAPGWQQAFERVAAPRTEALHPSDGLEVEGSRVWRVRAGRRVELGCAQARGTGAIHGHDRMPGGTDVFAAEHGLFVLSDEVTHLDHVELGDGAPEGEPVGVVAQDHDRVWVATRDTFGCVESRFWFGRTFRASDGLPPPPYTGLSEDADGALLLATEDGTYRYAPGRGPDPVVRVLTVDGTPHEAGRRYPVGPDGSFALTLEGDGLGGATLRYRREHHHLWVPLDPTDARVSGLEPGDHRILVTAWDRELRRSPEVAIAVRVAYPKAFDKRILIPLALGGCALVLGAFLLRARLGGGGGARYWRAVLSSFFLVAIGLQLLAAAIPHGRSWPFVGFSMYTERYVEDDVTYKITAWVVQADGSLHEHRPFGAGYGLYELLRTLSEVIHGSEADRQAFLEDLQRRHHARDVVGFLVLDERRRLTPDGPVDVAPTVMCVYPEDVLE